MSRILMSMIATNDLGPVSRLVPVAKELADRGHQIAFCNQAEAPALLIKQAGFKNLPVVPSMTPSVFPSEITAEIWNANQFWSYMGFLDLDYVRAITQDYRAMMEEFDPDLVVETWGLPAYLAAKILKKPIVTISQADTHPDANGFIWWRQSPANLPNPVPVINRVLKEYGLPLIREKLEELYLGDLILIVGSPETDPLPTDSPAVYLGPLSAPSDPENLPGWIHQLPSDEPLIWAYSGNPKYGDKPTFADSIVVIRACIDLLGNQEVQVVLTTGHQPLPDEFSPLPPNIHHASYVPGLAMAKKCDLFIHHGGHGSYLTGLSAGTPSIIIPTFSERESNARRLASLGAGEFVLPTSNKEGDKFVSMPEFREKVWTVLSDGSYKLRAQDIAESMQQYGGVSEAADHIEAMVA